MSYARWDGSSEFYAFWDYSKSGNTKDQQVLCLWHTSHKERDFCMTYQTCMKVLATTRFESIPGHTTQNESLLRDVITRFIKDVEIEEFR